MDDNGASASRPGSREPSPDGLGPSGFDPSRVRGWLVAMTRQGEDRIWRGAKMTLDYLNTLEAALAMRSHEVDYWEGRAND